MQVGACTNGKGGAWNTSAGVKRKRAFQREGVAGHHELVFADSCAATGERHFLLRT